MGELTYGCTNESLVAIVKGMDVNETDDILAICGSGDQAFALLEKAKSVIAMDINPCQITYAKYRKRQLKKGNCSEFLKHVAEQGLIFNSRYLGRRKRLNTIRNNLMKLELMAGDLFSYPFVKNQFSKLYLSNAWGPDDNVDYKHKMKEIVSSLREPGLVYMSTDYRMKRWHLGQCLVIDETLTSMARSYEIKEITHWEPFVFRKR